MRDPYQPGTMPKPAPERLPPSVAGVILSPQERARALTGALFDGPDLRGAACKGHARLFDEPENHASPDAEQARLNAARALCDHCPVRAPCAAVAAGLTDSQRAGVWAGTVYESSDARRARLYRERRAQQATTDREEPNS